MKTPVILLTCFLASSSYAIDDFNIQMAKILHEDTSLAHDVYTVRESSGLWDSKYPWFQKPSVSFRLNAGQQDRLYGPAYKDEIETYSPMIGVNFEVYSVNVGFVYSHSFVDEKISTFRPGINGDSDSVGGYVAKQFDCGIKFGATWAYTSADLGIEDGRTFFQFETTGASANIGFARSFGVKKFGRNVFVDTSANFLYQSEEDGWYFQWLAKVGHSFCERFSAYGLFNLYHEIDNGDKFRVPVEYTGYHPLAYTVYSSSVVAIGRTYSSDVTWGETGGGFQARIVHGVTFTAEATVPVLDEGIIAHDAFQVRGSLNWAF